MEPSPRSDLTGFNWSEVPCVLLEMGFMSNPEENALLGDPDYQARIVSGIAEGICTSFPDTIKSAHPEQTRDGRAYVYRYVFTDKSL